MRYERRTSDRHCYIIIVISCLIMLSTIGIAAYLTISTPQGFIPAITILILAFVIVWIMISQAINELENPHYIKILETDEDCIKEYGVDLKTLRAMDDFWS